MDLDPQEQQTRVNHLAVEVALRLGLTKLDAVELGLRLAGTLGKEDFDNGITAEKILSGAKGLHGEVGSFTMDELIDQVFQGQPVFSPHKVKVFCAKLLRASGFERRQFRRGPDRPLLWHLPL